MPGPALLRLLIPLACSSLFVLAGAGALLVLAALARSSQISAIEEREAGIRRS